MRKRFLKCMAFASALLLPGTRAGADTDILTADKGYSKVETTMPTDDKLADYYFVIVDKDKDLMMTLGTGKEQEADHKTWYYKASTNPAEDLNKVWMIEANNDVNGVTTGGYAFRNAGESTYLMQTEWEKGWFFRTHDQPKPCDWTQFIFKYDAAGAYWTFENGKYPNSAEVPTGDSNGYVGPWDPEKIEDGEVAANKKKDSEIGHFVIYSILRTDFEKLEPLREGQAETTKARITAEYQSVLDNTTAEEAARTTFQEAITTATGKIDAAASQADLENAMAELETARQEYMKKAEAAPKTGSFDMTFLIKNAEGTDLDGWTTSGTPEGVVFVQTNGQHWSGPGKFFFEIDNWSGASWNGSMSQTVTLPNGKYTLRAAGRAEKNAAAVSLSLTANGKTYKFPNVGDTGGTIATDGSEWESVDAGKAAGKTFAHDGAGYGWEWSKLETITVDAGTLEIKAEASATVREMWTSISDFKLMMVDEDAMAKQALEALIDSAGNIPETNVGTEAFKRPQDKYDALQTAIGKATTAKDAPENTAKEYNAAAEALQAAIDDFQKAELNPPVEGKRYNVVISVADFKYNDHAITFVAGENSSNGGYDVQLAKEVDPNFAQAFTFTKVDGLADTYRLSMTDSTGQERYLCTGKGYERGETYYTVLYTITEPEKALPVKIQLTDKEGIYKLLDTDTDPEDFPIGARGASQVKMRAQKGNTWSDFKLQEASEATVSLDVSEGWASLILPFKAKIPEGLKAYTWKGEKGEVGEDAATLTLNAVEKDSLEANTPYIVSSESKGSYEFSDYGLASDTVYADEHMKGYFVECDAEKDTYVLQKHGDELAFYKVGVTTTPRVEPYRACLMNPAVGISYSALRFPTRDLPSLVPGAAADEALVDVYSISGILVRSKVQAGKALEGLPKGVYVVDGKKKAVK